MKKEIATIDAYHQQYKSVMRLYLDEMREIIAKAAPNATEVISYGMPAFKQGKVLVYYAACKTHLGFYPTSSPIKVFAEELQKYTTSKGSIHFPYNEKLPVKLIKQIVKFRISEVEGNEKT
jgi:uncharacterized protein YdhG (YjbR/CyaY superfamily)